MIWTRFWDLKTKMHSEKVTIGVYNEYFHIFGYSLYKVSEFRNQFSNQRLYLNILFSDYMENKIGYSTLIVIDNLFLPR